MEEPAMSVTEPPLHGPLLRAEDIDVLVCDPYCVELDHKDGRHGILSTDWGRGYHPLEPMISPRGRTLPSLRGTPICHHDARNSESPLPSMLFHLQAPSGEGVCL